MDPNAEQLWVVWRRPKHSRDRWQKVPGLEPMSHDAAFKATIAQEWKVSWTDWEYLVAPVGQVPTATRTFGGSYQTKVMKPR